MRSLVVSVLLSLVGFTNLQADTVEWRGRTWDNLYLSAPIAVDPKTDYLQISTVGAPWFSGTAHYATSAAFRSVPGGWVELRYRDTGADIGPQLHVVSRSGDSYFRAEIGTRNLPEPELRHYTSWRWEEPEGTLRASGGTNFRGGGGEYTVEIARRPNGPIEFWFNGWLLSSESPDRFPMPTFNDVYLVASGTAQGQIATFMDYRARPEQAPNTIFLVHGFGQQGGEKGAMYWLAEDIRSLFEPTRFVVDVSFDYWECATGADCSPGCSISNAANKLARQIRESSAIGDIIIIGYSMGGLIARDMMLNHPELFTNRRIAALITLGTPHLGYPHQPVDDNYVCGPLARQMFGDLGLINPALANLCLNQGRLGDCAAGGTRIARVSPYLYDLNRRWTLGYFPGCPRVWYAAAGTECSRNIREIPFDTTIGCPAGTRNDDVVCQRSAAPNWAFINGPCAECLWEDPRHSYAHTDNWLNPFCFQIADYPPYPIWIPATDPNFDLLIQLWEWLNEIQ